jgi:hypothetical protein
MKRFYDFLNESLRGHDTVTIVRIAPSTNTYSSMDVTMYAHGDRTFDVGVRFEFRDKRTQNIEVSGKIVNVIRGTLSGTFRNEWNKQKIQEVAVWLESKGFSRGIPDDLDDAIRLDIKKRDITEEARKKSEGYVLWMRNPQVKDYVGGFDLNTFFEETLISYVEKGLVFGYIGHYARKSWMDKIMEEVCLPKIKADAFAIWLTSTSGRHFMDVCEKYSESDDIEGFRDYVKSKLPKIHDQAIVYAYPGHGGSLKDSIDIFDKLKEAGLTMLDHYEYGDW